MLEQHLVVLSEVITELVAELRHSNELKAAMIEELKASRTKDVASLKVVKGQKRATELANEAIDEGEAEKKPKATRKKRASKKKTPKAQTEIDTGTTLEDLSQLCQDYCKERGKAGAERIRKFLAKQGVKKIGELSAELQETLAINLRK